MIISNENLVIYKKTEELLYKIYPRLINYPKSEKFSLCKDIKDSFYGLLMNISLGNNVKSKRKEYLQTADGHLQVLKSQMKYLKNRRLQAEGGLSWKS